MAWQNGRLHVRGTGGGVPSGVRSRFGSQLACSCAVSTWDAAGCRGLPHLQNRIRIVDDHDDSAAMRQPTVYVAFQTIGDAQTARAERPIALSVLRLMAGQIQDRAARGTRPFGCATFVIYSWTGRWCRRDGEKINHDSHARVLAA